MYIYSFLVDIMLASLQQLLENLLERSAKEMVPWQVRFYVPYINIALRHYPSLNQNCWQSSHSSVVALNYCDILQH